MSILIVFGEIDQLLFTPCRAVTEANYSLKIRKENIKVMIATITYCCYLKCTRLLACKSKVVYMLGFMICLEQVEFYGITTIRYV